MARLPRFAPAGLPLHVTQRGNYGQNVFLTDRDRRFYLGLLDRHSAERRVKVIGFCLMPNHVHLILKPSTGDGLSILMQSLQCEYGRNFNVRNDQRGNLWKHRFDSCVIDETHLGIALAYVEMNPVRAGMTAAATDYEWSSARAHTGLTEPPAFLHMPAIADRFSKEDWNWMLSSERENRDELAAIRRATRLNEPFGAPDFAKTLERSHDRGLLRRPPGRPAKPRLHAVS